MRPHLRIEKPCEESLENMHTVPEGKFCDLCSKKVIDFSNFNDVEISKILEENKGKKVCGIFFKNQLNRPLYEERAISYPSRKMTFSKVAAGFALTASLINTFPAQTTKPVIKKSAVAKVPHINPKKEKEKTDNGLFTISGQIVSANKNKPLSAKVSFITVQKVYTAQTDKDGNYTLEVPKEILKYESLIEFDAIDYTYDKKFIIYKIEDLGKKQLIKLEYNGMDRMYGMVEIGPPGASEKSLVILDGKRLDYTTFNKSYYLYFDRYDVHYIPKEFVRFFTTKDSIADIYIAFVKPK